MRRFARDIIPWKICGRTLAVNVPENVLEILCLLLWKLSLNACMREFWARQGLIHGMLLRSLGSFIRCDDTLVHFGSGKPNVGKLKLLFEP